MKEELTVKCTRVEAFTKEEAIEKAGYKSIVHDCTIMWNRREMTEDNENFQEFIQEQAVKWTEGDATKACIVALESGHANAKVCPIKINDIKNTKGRRHFTKFIEVVDDEGRIWIQSKETKNAVKAMVRDLYGKGLIKGNTTARYVFVVDKGEPNAFTTEYSPSKSTKLGTYLVFGVE